MRESPTCARALTTVGQLPDRIRHRFPIFEEGEKAAQPSEPGDRAKNSTRQHEDAQRPAHSKDEQRRGCVADQDVLENVRREQVLLARPVERRDERERDASKEQQGPRRSHVVFPASAGLALQYKTSSSRRGLVADRRRVDGV